jgi:Asp-tRNA(Asn)/Glu-tRNA(Gln) amidotransferase B subunit
MKNEKINKLKNIIQVYTNTETMTNNKLAVEWLAKSYLDLLAKLNNEEISLKEFEIQYIELLEIAKEMEKEQMCKFAYKCHNHYKVYGDFNIEQYYEQKYGGNK